MAAKQLVRRFHFHSVKFSSPTPGIVGRIKNLVGLGDNSKLEDVDPAGKNAEPEREFMFDNVLKRMSVIASQSLQTGQELEEISLQDQTSKFKLLKRCHQEFGILPPNNIINESKSVQDIVVYYENLRNPNIVPEILKFEKDNLPANLRFQPPLPYKPAKLKT